jgi:hypothetical protein
MWLRGLFESREATTPQLFGEVKRFIGQNRGKIRPGANKKPDIKIPMSRGYLPVFIQVYIFWGNPCIKEIPITTGIKII